ncbi:MAG: hypothetical protein COA78_12395, partial [Blastopirellula sp.]
MKTWFKEKRRRLWIAFALVIITGILFLFVSRQFYFPRSQFWLLPQLQWDERADAEPSGERPVIIGHRGAGQLSSENDGEIIGNTANTIQAGIDAKADWIEIDIRLSEDGHLVVFHDDEISVRTNGEGLVAGLKLEDLQSVEVHVTPSEKILSLEEAFTRFHSPQQRWIFDIKAEEDISKEFLAWLNQSGLSKDQVILFGDYDLLLKYKNSDHNPGYTLGYTTLFDDNYLNVLFNPSQIIANCEDLNC